MKQADFFETVWGEQSGHAVTQPKTAHDGNWRSPQDTSKTTDQFFSPVVFSEKHRAGTDTAATCQVLYLDADRSNLDNFWSEPSIKVETSPGSFHIYFVLDSPVSMAEASTLSQRIARKHKMEASAGISAKLLRVPGTLNDSSEKVKDSGEPFLVTAESTGLVYSYADLAAEYPATPDEPKAVERADLDAPAEFPSTWDLEDRLPGYGSRLYHLLNEWDPETVGPDEANKRSERRYEAINLLLEFEDDKGTFTPEEVTALVWDSKLADKFRDQGRTIQDMWRFDVLKAIANQAAKDDPEVEAEPVVIHEIDLLSDDERAFVKGARTFIDEWTEDAYLAVHKKTPMQYLQYNALALLSCMLSPHFAGWRDAGKTQMLNLYLLNVGSQNSGKTEALNHMLHYVRVYDSTYDTHIDTGSSFTSSGLIKALRDRDGEAAFLHADEAAGIFKSWQQEAFSGAKELLLQLFTTPWLPKHLLAGKDAGNSENVRTYFSAYFMGTPRETFSAMTRNMLTDGTTARFIPIMAEAAKQEKDDKLPYRTRPGDETEFTDPDEKPREFGLRIQQLIKWAEKVNPEPGALRLPFTDEALARYTEFAWHLDLAARGHRDEEAAAAHARRLPVNVWKISALLAAERYSDWIEVSDLLTALKFGEMSWGWMLRVLDEVADSEFTRLITDVHRWLLSRGNKVRSTVVFAKSPLSPLAPKESIDVLNGMAARGIIKPFSYGSSTYVELVGG